MTQPFQCVHFVQSRLSSTFYFLKQSPTLRGTKHHQNEFEGLKCLTGSVKSLNGNKIMQYSLYAVFRRLTKGEIKDDLIFLFKNIDITPLPLTTLNVSESLVSSDIVK